MNSRQRRKYRRATIAWASALMSEPVTAAEASEAWTVAQWWRTCYTARRIARGRLIECKCVMHPGDGGYCWSCGDSGVVSTVFDHRTGWAESYTSGEDAAVRYICEKRRLEQIGDLLPFE